MAEERRIVTILFADVAGSTALGERLDPEDARILLRRYYDVARDTVGEYGGITEKFIGDAVVAVFGFPQTHDDDPQRALSAALALRDRVRNDSALGERLPIRIGINTGEVVAARESAAGDFPLTGDAVNVTARLQTAAEPWGILCGERTATGARGAFDFGPALLVDARGKAQPVRALPLVARARRTPVATKTALIGRDADLQQLELAGRRALDEKRPFLVSIIAPAGVGKTRLLEEFLHRLPSIESRATVAIAQCMPYGQRLTYWPLRGVLHRLIGVADDAMGHVVRDAIRAWLQGSGLEALDREVELLAATVGAGDTEVSDRSALLAAWRTFFEIAARRAPLVLVFEDLHWSSDSLLDLFEYVMQSRGELPLLMIALTRPELLDRRPAWGGGRRNYLSISLEPLSDRETIQLVDQLLEGCSPELLDRIVRRAEGNPFFAGELIRSVAEQSTPDQLPDTVQATVLARLDLLPPEERRVVQLGSIFGRAFRPPGLRALEPSLVGVDEVIDHLIDKDLLRPTGTDIFAFRHILIREVAYQTLTRAERGRLHAAAAVWLEGLAADREDALAELIAYHYREAALILGAQRPGDDETEQVRKKAAAWLSRAAEVAAAAAASLEGSRHLRSAIELAEPAALPSLYERLGDLAESGDLTAEAYQSALRLSRDQGCPPAQELRLLAKLLTNYMRFQGSVTNRLSEAAMKGLLDEGSVLLKQVTDERAIANYLAAEGFVPFWLRTTRSPTQEEVSRAFESATKALEIARRLDDPRLQSVALDALTGATQDQQDWRHAREFARERLRFQDRLGVDEKVDAFGMVVWASNVIGELDEAERVSAAGLAQVLPGQFPAWTLHLVAHRMYTLTLLGQWDEVFPLAEHARQLWNDTGRAAAGFATFGFMAAMDVARARHDASLVAHYGEIIDTILAAFPQGVPFREWVGYGRLDLSAVQAAIEHVRDEQLLRVERGISLLLDHDRIPDLQALRRILEQAYAHGIPILAGQAERAIGRAERDPARLSRAIGLFDGVGAVPYAARARCERGLLTSDDAELKKGLTVLERLGDTEQLGRFERLAVG
ncbi:MAG TPA: adenylate/guanylate cyclase domain-containing protein [Candidatus Dormibacteraeota bacterium]|nr:adenylate/guanylate cyclase domain-containing protein [Candidatus Dormibacteraeota bacterium]